ncbi:eCIS core domain-containing protein [Yinghuangia sp. YIM S09857]|uniref:eCIS core domain-containing protein n=1 Tax=Yinghuangia sp. YIM S09857 TaxID=3436929 RepID=UPI003F531504
MRAQQHDHDEDRAGTRTPERHEHEHTALLFKAAAAGRPEVVGRSGAGTLQRAVGNRAVRAMLAEERAVDEPTRQRAAQEPEPKSSVHDVVGSGGSPMDTDTRTDMEARLGADFGDVRIHTDGQAHESAKDVGAHAYTVGSDVVFQRDKYDPASHEGKTMLAHELTHVIQQRNGPVEGTQTSGGIRVSDPSDRFEREAVANADRVMSAPSPATPSADAGPSVARSAADNTTPAPAAAVQRAVDEGGASAAADPTPVQRAGEEEEDEEPADVQGAFVQRAAGEEEQEEEPVE